MPFGTKNPVGPRHRVFPSGKGILRGVGAIGKHYDSQWLNAFVHGIYGRKALDLSNTQV